MQLSRVRDVIRDQSPLTLPFTATVSDAARLMAKHQTGAILITRDGNLEGIFTERDVSFKVMAASLNPDTTPLHDVMTFNPVTLKPDDTVLGALQKIHAGDYRHLPVLDENHLMGVVSVRDIYKYAIAQRERDMTNLRQAVSLQCTIVPDLISKQVIASLEPSATVIDAAQLMAKRKIGAVLIIQEGALKGIFTERDVSLRVVAANLNPETTCLNEVMTADPVTLNYDDKAIDVVQNMQAGNYRHVPVFDGPDLLGIVSIRDLYGCMESGLEESFRSALYERAHDMAREGNN